MCYDEFNVSAQYWGLDKCAYENNKYLVDAVEYLECLNAYEI